MKLKPSIILMILFITLISSSACASPNSSTPTELSLAPQSDLPDFVLGAEPEMQEAYRFAIANPDILKQYPCYCGCQEVLAHMHNLDCYIKQINPDGSVELDPHGLAWPMCIDITRDVMRLTQQGQSQETILAYIESEYKPLAPTDGKTLSCGNNPDGGCGESANNQDTVLNLEAIPQVNVPATETANKTSNNNPPQTTDFTQTLADTIKQQTLLPDFAELVVAPLYLNERTFSFTAKNATVLQLNIFGYPDPKFTETLVAPLINVSTTLATQHNIPLTGIEIIFHRRHTLNPMLIFAATPPWGTEQTIMTPLSDELEQLSNEILKISPP